jgi:alpha/beta superfamily hydrolase
MPIRRCRCDSGWPHQLREESGGRNRESAHSARSVKACDRETGIVLSPLLFMKAAIFPLLLAAILAACDNSSKPPQTEEPKKEAPKLQTLGEARQGFSTKLLRKEHMGKAPEAPPATLFQLVRYSSPIGKLAAYVSPKPAQPGKHPAILWIVGGFSNSISPVAWTPSPAKNDQSASAFREAGVIMMYSSLRGGNDNPGAMEGFYGEVDDVLAAADYLAKLDYVDPQRIYLGGHSTGGTLALLAAESTNRFRAVFSFGPVEDVAGYGEESLPFDLRNAQELRLRAPGRWLPAIKTRTFIMEGAGGRSNIGSLRAMQKLPHSEAVTFLPIPGADHFSTLAPITRLLARKILADTGEKTNITLSEEELAAAMKP